MSDWNADENPYEVLGINLESTKDEQKKRYRKLVLEKHPDKQPGNKRAAAEFIKIQRAYEILTDDKAREAWDNLQRTKMARQAKHAGQSEKRRKMAQDLERREEMSKAERSQEKAARDKLQAELARIRREMAEREEQVQAKMLQERIARDMAQTSAAAQSAMIDDQLQRTIKASWDEGVSSYTEQELQGIFRAHGEVQEAILRPVKKKNKGSAIIIMRDGQGARKAANAVCGSLVNPLLVVPLAKSAFRGDETGLGSSAGGHLRPAYLNEDKAAAGPAMPAMPMFPGQALPVNRPLFAAVHNSARASQPSFPAAAKLRTTDFESGIFAKIRQKAELDRLASKRDETGSGASGGGGQPAISNEVSATASGLAMPATFTAPNQAAASNEPLITAVNSSASAASETSFPTAPRVPPMEFESNIFAKMRQKAELDRLAADKDQGCDQQG